MLQVYAKSVSGTRRRLFRKILRLMKGGSSFVDIVIKNCICSSDLNMLLSLADQIGNLGQVFNNLHEYLSDRIREKNQLMSKISYPIILLIMIASLLVFVATVLIPQFKGFYESYNVEIPLIIKLLEMRFLIVYCVVLIVVILVLSIMGKKINKKLLLSVPIVSTGIKLKFQNMLFQIMKYSIIYGVPVNHLIDKVMDTERSVLHKYYLSTISILLKQGNQISEVLDIPIIEQKYQKVLEFAQGKEKEKEILDSMIIENKENNERYYDVLVSVAGFVAMAFAGLIVFLIGYLMMSPLQNINMIL